MNRSTRDRLVLPVLLPVGILVVLAAVLFGFSRILLSVKPAAATATALLAALGVLVLAAVISGRGPVTSSGIAAMLGGVAGVAMLAGGIALAVVGPEAAVEEGGPPATVVSLVAKDIAFQQTALTVPAGKSFGIAFENQDAGVQHNVVIYDNPDHTGTPLFKGELITGVAKTTYVVDALDAGTYHFACQVHPNMTGTIEAVAGGAGAALTVTAEGMKFDTDKIELTAEAATTITFDNKDAGVPHNIAFYTANPADDPSAEVLFRGEQITGPATIDYQVPPLQAGTYYFQCDVHPTMNGKLVVREAGAASPEPSPTATVSAAPSPTATASQAPSPSKTGGGAGGTTVTVTAQGLKFESSTIELPANTAATIHFVNNDAGTQHNIAIYTSKPGTEGSTALFTGELLAGPDSRDYEIPPLPPGTYYFMCLVHPDMNGTVVVS